tara:strand:- start:218 stop:370 length:153 start_codon:yes stop_codon:yes gene_type:complete
LYLAETLVKKERGYMLKAKCPLQKVVKIILKNIIDKEDNEKNFIHINILF